MIVIYIITAVAIGFLWGHENALNKYYFIEYQRGYEKGKRHTELMNTKHTKPTNP